MKILVVDDSRSIHAFLNDALAPLSPEIYHAYNGLEGLKMVRAQAFDLVLMDWEMPIMSGPEALSMMRAVSSTLPIVMMTTRNSVEDLAMAMRLGASEYMMKPFTREILHSRIEQTLKGEVSYAA